MFFVLAHVKRHKMQHFASFTLRDGDHFFSEEIKKPSDKKMKMPQR